MKQIILNKLTAKHYRGKTFDFTFGMNNDVRARNRGGKSTILNAFLWLLTGADVENRTNYNLFDNTRQITHDINEITKVEGVFTIDGVEYTVTRTAKMGWTRPRGSEVWERKSNDDYSFSIDGIERTATVFKQWIEDNFAPMDMIKCCANTQYFLYGIDWKQQRNYLAQIAGDITYDDLKGDYTLLKAELDKYTCEELRERIKTNLTPLKKALGSDNVKGEQSIALEVLQSNLVDIKKVDEADKELENLKKKREELKDQLRGIKSPIDEASKRRAEAMLEIEAKERELKNAKYAYLDKLSMGCSDLERKLREIDAENESIRKQNAMRLEDIARCEKRMEKISAMQQNVRAKLEDLRRENVTIKERTFNDFNCSYCGQRLPEDKIADLQAQFEAKREKEREHNVEMGKLVKEELQTLVEEYDSLADKVAKLQEQEPIALVDTTSIKEQILQKNASYPAFEDTEEYKALSKTIADMRENLPQLPVVNTSEIDAQISEMDEQIAKVMETVSMRSLYVNQCKQMSDIKESMRAMAQERAEWERLETLLREYEQEKADVVGMRVNKFFDKCNVSMYSEKKDGTLIPNCVITMGGVQSSTLNKEGTITAGVDVSNAFCKYYGINMPLFVDDNESLSSENRVKTDRQLITLTVDDCDVTLFSKD